MSDNAKWPFDSSDRTSSKGHNDQAIQREHQRLAAEVAHRQHLRNDRLIVGGRAHTKKPGLG
jgi:hypothetical protein